MIDDEVGAHTRVTVLAYWKFESVSLQRGVGCELDFGRDVEGERYLSWAERIRRGSIVPWIEVPLLVSRTDRKPRRVRCA